MKIIASFIISTIITFIYFLKQYERKHMTKLDEIIEQYPDFEFLKADGFDDCVIGYEYNWDGNMRLIYSIKGIIDKLIEQGMSDEDAIEYFEFNMRGAYIGEKTPIWCQDDF
jgi:microsomal dipeptidase-like Zn-dependent dipeptidase